MSTGLLVSVEVLSFHSHAYSEIRGSGFIKYFHESHDHLGKPGEIVVQSFLAIQQPFFSQYSRACDPFDLKNKKSG